MSKYHTPHHHTTTHHHGPPPKQHFTIVTIDIKLYVWTLTLCAFIAAYLYVIVNKYLRDRSLMWVWVKKLCFINIFMRTFRKDDKIWLGKFFLSISVTICTLIIGESMGAIGAVVACYRERDVIVSLSDFHRGLRLSPASPFLVDACET